MTIAESLKRLMHEEGLNNITFAQLLGLAAGTVSRYVSGYRIPNLKRLQQISSVFDRNLVLTFIGGNIHSKFQLREHVREITFDEKLELCRNPLFGYCRNRLHLTKENAEDLVQETMYRAMKLHSTWRPEVAMLTWLIGIAKRAKDRSNSNLSFLDSYIGHEQLTEESEDAFRYNVDLFKYVEKLNPSRKKYYQLYAIGLSHREIAEKMNSNENAVKEKIKNIKRLLRRKIENASLKN